MKVAHVMRRKRGIESFVKRQYKIKKGCLILSLLLVTQYITKKIRINRFYDLLIYKLIVQASIFDRSFYLQEYPDVQKGGADEIMHFIKYGEKEGRSPSPIFEPTYYKNQISKKYRSTNSLVHYMFLGRFTGKSPSVWFNTKYYLANNKDVARSKIDPLVHFLEKGGVEGRNPCESFDSLFYLANNSSQINSGMNPLLHYLALDKFDRDVAILPNQLINNKEINDLDYDEIWDAFPINDARESVVLDIIIPAYKNKGLTLQCIYSVLSSKVKIAYELIVINDASPDKELQKRLEILAKRKLITLISNNENLGFVKTVNKGFNVNTNRDVVILNSDTEVYGNWLDRLRDIAYQVEKCGTVTPFSNNATICSYPRFLHDNPYPLEIEYKDIDHLASQVNHGIYAVAPTGVGFCMYIKRDCLDQVGVFDEDSFGRGYGEENDFCQRAIKLGWQNLIAANVFVRHFGGASFLGETAERVSEAMKKMAQMHPQYLKEVESFIQLDPLKIAREHLDWARMEKQSRAQNVLIVCHNRGGGSEKHVQEDVERILEEGIGVYFMRPDNNDKKRVKIINSDCLQTVNVTTIELTDESKLSQILKELNITHIHSHGLVDFTDDAPTKLFNISKK